jgi:hypothetical protein
LEDWKTSPREDGEVAAFGLDVASAGRPLRQVGAVADKTTACLVASIPMANEKATPSIDSVLSGFDRVQRKDFKVGFESSANCRITTAPTGMLSLKFRWEPVSKDHFADIPATASRVAARRGEEARD